MLCRHGRHPYKPSGDGGRDLRPLWSIDTPHNSFWLGVAQLPSTFRPLKTKPRLRGGFCRSAYRTVGGIGGIGAAVTTCLLSVSRESPRGGSTICGPDAAINRGHRSAHPFRCGDTQEGKRGAEVRPPAPSFCAGTGGAGARYLCGPGH